MVDVSVIIPVYNTGEYLEECLNSIVNQTLNDIEIICVDDGSTDNSLEILKNYEKKDSRITVISQENQGPSSARNKGIQLATGKYMYFMDSDDFLELDALEKLFDIAEEKNTDIVLFKLINYDDKTHKKHSRYYYDMPYLKRIVGEKVFNYKDIGDYVFDLSVCTPVKLFKRKIFEGIEFPEGIKYEDNLYAIETFFKAERMFFLDEYLYNRRLRSDSIINSFHEQYEDFLIMNDLFFDKVKELGHFEEFKHQLYLKKLLNAFIQFSSTPEEYKPSVFKAFKSDFLKNKNDYESDDVFLNKIDERLRCIFYSCINAETYREFELSVNLFDEKSEIKKLNEEITNLKKKNDDLKKQNDHFKSAKAYKLWKKISK